MYRIRAAELDLRDSFIAYGETKQEVIAKMFQWLEVHHSGYIGQPTMARLAELDAQLNLHIEEF
jgi:hypothetical protein